MRLSTKDQKTLLLSAPRSAIRNMEEVDKLIPSLAETILDKYKKGFPCHLETEISKIYDGTNLLILGKKEEVGALSPEEVEKVLKEKGYACSLINARFAKPLDEETLRTITTNHKLIVTMEENVINGGMGEHVTEFYGQNEMESVHVLNIAIPDEYVEHGNVDILRKEVGIDAETITRRTVAAYEKLLKE